jgi:fatty acid desaturase
MHKEFSLSKRQEHGELLISTTSHSLTHTTQTTQDSTQDSIQDSISAPAPSKSFANRDYRELKRLIAQHHLLDKQPRYYLYKFVLTFGLLALSLGVLLLCENLWLQLFNALFLGFVSAQVAFLGHDAGHRQILPTARGNDLIGYFVSNLVSGASFSWWLDDHNRHHAHTNDLQHDPNLQFPVLAIDASQLEGKRPFQRFIIKHQKFLFFPLLTLASFNIKGGSIKFMLQNRFPTRPLEALLIAVHYLLYYGVVVGAVGWWSLPFVVLHQLSAGLFLGAVFAPNHKGMPILEGEARLDFLRSQVLTSRNVRSHPITDFLYGGLNYQIEHHLFPSIPRNQMPKLQGIVKPFCEEREVSYHETSTWGSYREIMDFLHEVSAPLRQK